MVYCHSWSWIRTSACQNQLVPNFNCIPTCNLGNELVLWTHTGALFWSDMLKKKGSFEAWHLLGTGVSVVVRTGPSTFVNS